MKTRLFPTANRDVSLLGFGCMRLPLNSDNPADINEAESIRMIRHAIDCGVNYVDTAYIYHAGQSEVVLGKALKDGYGERVIVADKLPFWKAKNEDDLEGLLDTSLERLNIDCIDNYLIHSIDNKSRKKVSELNIIAFMHRMKEKGKIKHIGFSYHGDTPELFKEVIDLTDWDFCQIQLNYMDANYQAGVAGLKYAASKNIGVVIMEPLKGGKLTDRMPDAIRKYWDSTPVKRTPAEWAFRWVANFPEVMTILSGMSTFEQVEENLQILSDADANNLTDHEAGVIRKVSDIYNDLTPYSCTGCNYCMPCPNRLAIPTIIGLRNEADMFNCPDKIADTMKMFVKTMPHECVACGNCEERCPQHLPIANIMKESAEMFE